MLGLRKKKKMTKNVGEPKVSTINSSTSSEGTISCQSSIRFDGKHKGEINAVNRIVIGEKAIINGNLVADNIEIFGLIKGDCRVRSSITLTSTANYTGNIFTKQIIILEGAVLNGNLHMTVEKNDEIKVDKNRIVREPNKKQLHKIAMFLFSLIF